MTGFRRTCPCRWKSAPRPSATASAESLRSVLTSAGFFEAVTMSFVSERWHNLFQPRGRLPRLTVDHSSRKHENVLRQSLIPSLLLSRQVNQRHGNFNAELFEIAKVYLHAPQKNVRGAGRAPDDRPRDGPPVHRSQGNRGGDRPAVCVLERPSPSSRRRSRPLLPAAGPICILNGTLWGWLGELDRAVTDAVDLKDAVTAAELDVGLLGAQRRTGLRIQAAGPVPRDRSRPEFCPG